MQERARTAGLASAFGHSLHIDLYGVDPALCDDIAFFYALLDDLVERLQMHKQAPPFIFRSPAEDYPDKAGLSGWVPLIESGISVHTITPRGFVSIDIYTCGDLHSSEAADYLVARLAAASHEMQYLVRGAAYYER